MKKTYLIKYVAFGKKPNAILKHGTMRCKDQPSELAAQAGLEKYLTAKLPGFTKLTVLEINEETQADWLDYVFNNLFKK